MFWKLHFKSNLTEVESRTQGSRPRPRTQKKSEAKAKDSLSEDRTFRGQGRGMLVAKAKNRAVVSIFQSLFYFF